MSVSNRKKRNELIYQLIIVVVILILVFVVFYQLGMFRESGSENRTVVYKVEGSAAQVMVIYTQADGTESPRQEVTVPWRYTLDSLPSGKKVILTVGNPTQTGDITCKIIIDGEVWREQKVEYPQDKVSCGGFIP